MTQPVDKRLGWLFLTALAAIAVTTGSPASAQTDPVQVPAAGAGVPAPALPTTSREAAVANTTPTAGPAGTTVRPTHREPPHDCMGYWDAEAHMSKSQWRAACQRTLNGTDMGGLDPLGGPEPAARSGLAKHRSHRALP
jgi:hypothetical protein